jgi:hypothetical protein
VSFVSFFFFFFFGDTGDWTLLGKGFTTWAMFPVLLFLQIGCLAFAGSSLRSQSSCLQLPSSWDYRHDQHIWLVSGSRCFLFRLAWKGKPPISASEELGVYTRHLQALYCSPFLAHSWLNDDDAQQSNSNQNVQMMVY